MSFKRKLTVMRAVQYMFEEHGVLTPVNGDPQFEFLNKRGPFYMTHVMNSRQEHIGIVTCIKPDKIAKGYFLTFKTTEKLKDFAVRNNIAIRYIPSPERKSTPNDKGNHDSDAIVEDSNVRSLIRELQEIEPGNKAVNIMVHGSIGGV